ncbi:MAG TPA: hypothetical protein VM783_00875 [Candidatus Acidoferrum sp.]|nr:hypothetical protein [Candidatus Acidoferrum sp.]
MMTSKQREMVYRAIGYLQNTLGGESADALRAALEELDAARLTLAKLAALESERVGPDPLAVPRTAYTYWVSFRWSHEGTKGVDAKEITRSTPILTRQDIDSVSAELVRLAGGGTARVLAYSPMAIGS